jgi:cell wall-associated NlpC family hydrolase
MPTRIIMTATALDPRLNAYLPGLADSRLRGRVTAERFVDGTLRRTIATSAPLRRQPDTAAPYDSELLAGEGFLVFAEGGDGWSWGQCETDGYVGFVSSDLLGPAEPAPTHRVVALRTFIYPGPDVKLPPTAALSLGSRLALGEAVETRGTRFLRLVGGGVVVASHVAPLDAAPEPDFVAVAERFLNVPYLWGGRTSLGLDCSALVQVSLMAAGVTAPRDSDLQQLSLGRALNLDEDGSFRRGDLAFWPGHVAILAGPDTIVHASGHHMAVVAEPLADAVARIGSPPAVVKRLAPAAMLQRGDHRCA